MIIYNCRHVRQKRLTAEDITWEAFVDRLSRPEVLPVTGSELEAMDKAAKSDLKDVGGYLGGELDGGDRKKLINRCLLCLDADNGDEGILDDWQRLFPNVALCLHSTLSHRPERPRYRLVAPLDRAVTPAEYEELARQVVELLGAHRFDPTTTQAGRVMFYPSVPSDGGYVCQRVSGVPLNTTSPLHEALNPLKRGLMEDPLTKSGLVGAFCRAYPIREAVEAFVPDYVPHGDRYTYAKGSTVGGVVVYEDRFTYSNHATDPAGGREVNAYDLVRIHKFGGDQKRMTAWVQKDPKVKEQLFADALADFDDEQNQEAADPVDRSWIKELAVNKAGQAVSSYKNIELILSNDPKLKGLFAFDQFARRAVLTRSVSWRGDGEALELTDADDAAIRAYLDKTYGITGKDKIWDCTLLESRKHRFHPVKDYLESLHWDGVARAETLLIDCFGCEDCAYVRQVTYKTLLAAVSRIYEPGCQWDCMLTLKGPQGVGKSTFFRKLAKGWFSDSVKDIRGKDALEGLHGVWIVEMGELAAMRKADAEAIKSFLSSRTDRFRVAYGRRSENFPRQCIFTATTNEAEFLRDRTGNRRFWVVEIPKGRTPKVDVFNDFDPDPIWAEVMTRYKAGERDLTLSADMEREAEQRREVYMQDDPKVPKILEYLARDLPEDWESLDLPARQLWLSDPDNVGTIPRQTVCVAELWCEALGYSDTLSLRRSDSVELTGILDNLDGWTRGEKPKRYKIYGLQKFFTCPR